MKKVLIINRGYFLDYRHKSARLVDKAIGGNHVYVFSDLYELRFDHIELTLFDLGVPDAE
jgi:hypothetical protein